MKLLRRSLFLLRNIPSIMRGVWVAGLIRAMGGQCGLIFVSAGFDLRSIPHKGISIGHGVVFGPNVRIYAPKPGRLTIGDRCKFTSDIFVSALGSVEIGEDTIVAEYTSIRDADHGYAQHDIPIWRQPMKITPVMIGCGVWIGRGVAVLRGSWIGDGAVIGANAVVKSDIPAYSVAVGVPARIISNRLHDLPGGQIVPWPVRRIAKKVRPVLLNQAVINRLIGRMAHDMEV
jgi:acetyltransferase-like isoleucine patch superfamily enzyme